MKTVIIKTLSLMLCFAFCFVPFYSCNENNAEDTRELALGSVRFEGNWAASVWPYNFTLRDKNDNISGTLSALKNITNRPKEERDTKTVIFKEKLYELEYSGTYSYGFGTPYDTYKTVEKNAETGMREEFRFAVGTDTLIGIDSVSIAENGGLSKLSDNELATIAREFLSDFADMSYYKNVKVLESGRVYFYNEVGGVMLGDYAQVNMDRYGKINSCFACPNPSVFDPSLFGKLDASELDSIVKNTVKEKYTGVTSYKAEYNYTSCEINDSIVTVDDDGKYYILCFCDVSFTLEWFKGAENYRDFAYVAVEINEKE